MGVRKPTDLQACAQGIAQDDCSDYCKECFYHSEGFSCVEQQIRDDRDRIREQGQGYCYGNGNQEAL